MTAMPGVETQSVPGLLPEVSGDVMFDLGGEIGDRKDGFLTDGYALMSDENGVLAADLDNVIVEFAAGDDERENQLRCVALSVYMALRRQAAMDKARTLAQSSTSE